VAMCWRRSRHGAAPASDERADANVDDDDEISASHRTSRLHDAPRLPPVPVRDGDAALHPPLESRDLSLVHSMIPLGSCTMKLNAAPRCCRSRGRSSRGCTRSRPRPGAGLPRAVRPARGLARGDHRLRRVSLQPNAGSQGEYAGLLVIRAYHEARGREPPRRLPDPAVRARHQPRQRRHGRLRRGRREVR
jgi:hypothetical protein